MASRKAPGRKAAPPARRKRPAASASDASRLRKELAEARAQQAATAAILKVISRSPNDVQPVFQAIVEHARRLMGGRSAALIRVVGAELRLAAMTHTTRAGDKALEKFFPAQLSGRGIHSVAAHDRIPVIVRDTDAEWGPQARAMARARGYRSVVAVPLLRKGLAVGVVSVTRKEPGDFSRHEIALLKIFADQAVIAIENVRLFNETKESLEQKTATAEILKVISNSPGDLRPVFDAILKSATQLCDAHLGILNLREGDRVRTVAQRGGKPRFAKWVFARGAFIPENLLGRMFANGKLVHVPDIKRTPGYSTRKPNTYNIVHLGKARTYMAVPMLRDGAVIGGITVYRSVVRPFTPQQIELLSVFASQAVIAIENARLFNETKESLERQTATAEILKVIASSPSDVQPVLNAVAERAGRICNSPYAGVMLQEGDVLRPVADWSQEKGHLPPFIPSMPIRKTFAIGHGFLERRTVHAEDYAELVRTRYTDARANLRRTRARTLVTVPLMREKKAVGMLTLWRRELRPYTKHEIALLETFADQAVIAIENVRLFNETKEALARQTATADILGVIGSSMTDAKPVFEAIVRSCAELFGEGAVNLRLLRNGALAVQASHNYESDRVLPINRDSAIGACVLDGQTIHLPDLEKAAERFPRIRQLGLRRGFHSGIYTPLLREGKAIGSIAVLRRTSGAFSDKEVALLKTFADQAVIAIENVRLFNETKEALERQTATAEILRVIASSPSDVQPVFDAIVGSAVRLVGGFSTVVTRFVDGKLHLAAYTSVNPTGDDELKSMFPRALEDTIPVAEAIRTKTTTFVSDVSTDTRVSEQSRELARKRGYRSLMHAPMLQEGEVIGVIHVTRVASGEFSAHHIGLIEAFANQAVIAIQNVRLFNETKEALERQTATADILRVISSSPTDVRPVLDAVAERATKLCSAMNATVFLSEGGVLRRMAYWGEREDIGARQLGIDRLSVNGRAFVEGRTVHVDDIVPLIDAEYPAARENQSALGFRTMMAVPMLRKGEAIGTIGVWRRDVKPFSEQEIGLLQTFADQAAIAIENVRLFNETKETLDRQTATAEILKVIASSPSDVQPVFDSIAESALRLCGGGFSVVTRFDGEFIQFAAMSNVLPEAEDAIRKIWPVRPGRGTATARAISEAKVIQIPDMREDPEYELGDVGQLAKFRSLLAVPMLRDGKPIGAINVNRAQPGEFPAQQVALLQTFADQAVIAIENVRLFNETKEALERQTATAEILSVIASSPSDVQPVLDAVAANAARLCEASDALIQLRDGESFSNSAHFGEIAANPRGTRIPITRETVSGRAILEARQIHVRDLQAETEEFPEGSALARKMGYRTNLTTPLMHKGAAIGTIMVRRTEASMFDEKHIALVKTFADQAVIAIENVRLFNETKEALERQTATAEILKVIASSPSDVQPVFDAIAESAKRLLSARSAVVRRLVGDSLEVAAYTSTGSAGDQFVQQQAPQKLSESGTGAMAVRTGAPSIVPDTEDGSADVPEVDRQRGRERGFRSLLVVPMLREGAAIGTLGVARSQPGQFSDHQIDLLKTFADQAVIAIENVRLFNETKEALEQQTATADILKVISSSPTDTQPVFEAIVRSGLKLFPNAAVIVTLPDGGRARLAAIAGADSFHAEQWKQRHQFPLTREYMHAVAILDGVVIDVPDAQAYGDGPLAVGIRNFLATGSRAITIMPMLRADAAIGTISVIRLVPGSLTEKQIALLRTFADQAVIAIENVRLFNETKEALEQQTATAEILKVISESPTDTQPVFEAIVQSGLRLFPNAAVAVVLPEGNKMRMAAVATQLPAQAAAWRAGFGDSLSRDRMHGAAILDSRLVDIPDAEAEKDGPFGPGVKNFLAGGNRAITIMPMICDDAAIGAISVIRLTPGPLSEKQLALLRTFAAQAVIAIENVRLFNETKEALERQTATAEILQVISGSPTDAQPVFDAIVRSGMKLFSGAGVGIGTVDGDEVVIQAAVGMGGAGKGFRMPLSRESASGQAILERKVVNIRDTEAPDVPLHARENGRRLSIRSMTQAPMFREGEPIGSIGVMLKEPGGLDDKQLALLRTFADQTVIAIENVRLFKELEARNRDVTDALERQTATAEILRVISSTPTDTRPVFDAIVQSALHLFGGMDASILLADGGQIQLVAAGGSVDFEDRRRQFPIPLDRESVAGRTILDAAVTDVGDTEAPQVTAWTREYARKTGYRAISNAPLLREGVAIGAIGVTRRDPGALSAKHLDLLKTFADQAVIAIENVRLFNETKEALERQTATAEILKVISGSPTDVQPVLDAIVQSAARLFVPWNAAIVMREGNLLQLRASAGPRVLSREDQEVAQNRWPLPFDPEKVVTARVISDLQTHQILDIEAPDVLPGVKATARAGKYRSIAWVPLVRDREGIGSIVLTHAQPGYAFSEKQLALVRTFADQAVIAIENVRLFKELESRTEALTKSVGQLTALGEVGQAISSTLDLEQVLQTIVSRAVQLTGMDAGSIYEYDAQAEVYRLQAAEKMEPELVEAVRKTPIRKGDGATGRTAVTLEPVQVADIEDKSYQGSRKDNLRRTGYRAVLAVPLLREDVLLGALQVFRKTPGPFTPDVVELLKTFATQSAMAIQNARLFREIAEKGKQLEVASRHKSDFLASMSHELRTPLNAILGFNEMLLGQVYGEVPADMQEPLEDIQKSGKHLLRLINNVLDLAKIEAGRMELSLQDYSVQDTVESVRATLRPLAAEKGLEFLATVPQDLPLAYGDSGRITQCLMNLAGNSLKFTKAGKVEIAVTEKDGLLTYRVTDTGVGIPPDKIGSLFTEFKQTDATIASEYGGTGLGLSISKKFVEMHGGRIWIESELGKGSSFIFEIPLRVGA